MCTRPRAEEHLGCFQWVRVTAIRPLPSPTASISMTVRVDSHHKGAPPEHGERRCRWQQPCPARCLSPDRSQLGGYRASGPRPSGQQNAARCSSLLSQRGCGALCSAGHTSLSAIRLEPSEQRQTAFSPLGPCARLGACHPAYTRRTLLNKDVNDKLQLLTS